MSRSNTYTEKYKFQNPLHLIKENGFHSHAVFKTFFHLEEYDNNIVKLLEVERKSVGVRGRRWKKYQNVSPRVWSFI